MQQFVNDGFCGLTTAAVFAIAASGLVLLYPTTGVFNFAHGAMGMIAAFAYWEMRFGWHWPAPVALAVCLLILAPALWRPARTRDHAPTGRHVGDNQAGRDVEPHARPAGVGVVDLGTPANPGRSASSGTARW